MCQEDTSRTCCITRIAGVFKNSNAFCMPACGQRVTVVFDSISDLPIGAWFWAYGIGVLKIVSYNVDSGEVTLENICPSDPCGEQAAPGTPIPACTIFLLDRPDCSGGSSSPGSLYPYLASGFVAPSPGNCIDIAVTNVNGLSVNKNVTINGGTYRISAILSGTLITICNDGSGLTPGTVVDYLDGSGNYIVPIVLIDANPCTNPAVLAGVPIVCDNSIMTPLEGSENGQVLVWDSVTEEASFRTLGLPVLDCTSLTVCLTLDPLNPPGTSYLVQVVDTSAYAEHQIVVILGVAFEIDTIDSPTTMHIIPVEGVYVVENFPAGSQLCSADCCTQLEARVDDMEDNQLLGCGQWLDASINHHDADAIVETAVSDSLPVLDPARLFGETGVFTVTNNSCKYSMGIHVVINAVWIYDLYGEEAQGQDVGHWIEYYVGNDGGHVLSGADAVLDTPKTYVYTETVEVPHAVCNRQSFAASYSHASSIAPGETFYLMARNTISWNAGNMDHMQVKQLATRISYAAVAVR